MFLLVSVLISCKDDVPLKSEVDSTIEPDDSPMMTIRSKQKHLAQAQLYRWYQLYERELSDVRIANTMDMLSDSIYLKSASGEMKGKTNYPDRVKVFEGWKNAHHVDNVQVSLNEKGNFFLEADIRYQNIQPTGEKASYSIHYNTLLEEDNSQLPDFTSIEIVPTGATNEEFVDAYPVNRAKSLMHYWLANMEMLDGDVTPFKELLADDFELNFSTSSVLKSIEDLETWLRTIPTQLKESAHTPKEFSVKTIMDNEYEMTVLFDWTGVRKDGVKMEGTTKHIWYIVDDINLRFAKILKVDVTQIKPIKVVD